VRYRRRGERLTPRETKLNLSQVTNDTKIRRHSKQKEQKATPARYMKHSR